MVAILEAGVDAKVFIQMLIRNDYIFVLFILDLVEVNESVHGLD